MTERNLFEQKIRLSLLRAKIRILDKQGFTERRDKLVAKADSVRMFIADERKRIREIQEQWRKRMDGASERWRKAMENRWPLSQRLK